MNAQKTPERFTAVYELAIELSKSIDADALFVLVEGAADWDRLKRLAGRKQQIVVATDTEEKAVDARAAGLAAVVLKMADGTVYDKITQALIGAVADEILMPGAEVVAVYSGFEAGVVDSFSYIRLDEHLGRLTARDLQKLETKVPLQTLKTVVDLAVEIGREGREGKPVGTLFVVGDSQKVLAASRSIGFDPVKGYSRKERCLLDPRVREAVKEVAPLDGAIIVSADGTVEAACRLLDVAAANVTLSKGLGARHWAAAAISKKTRAIAVAVSESTGTVRLFHNGQVILRVEPFRRAMKWKDFEYEPPASE